jgi:hypothetical protein
MELGREMGQYDITEKTAEESLQNNISSKVMPVLE